jgi:hypothetical protein
MRLAETKTLLLINPVMSGLRRPLFSKRKEGF